MSANRTIQTNALDGVQSIPNYIGNGKATYGTTAGWAVYADAAGTSPVDGTGGSPNVTISTSASSPLSLDNSFLLVKDAANRQGQGWSYDFTIQSCDQAKVLQLQLDYLISSGTFVAGSSTTDSDVTLWLYDVTNSTLIQPSTFRLYSNSSTNSSSVVSNFQTASNSTSYRLILHVGSTSASAYTLKIDNVSVSPTQYVYGTPITDWASYTPTFTGMGTVSSIECLYRRVGGDYELRNKLVAGTPTAVEARASLPNSATSADTTKIPSIQLSGMGAIQNQSQPTVLIEPSVGYVTFGLQSGTQAGYTKVNGNALLSTGNIFTFFASVPIQGLSSSVQMSDSADTRVVDLSVVLGANQAVTANNPVKYDTVLFDSHGAYSTSTGKYTVPVSGDYQILANGAAGSASGWYVQKNSTKFSYLFTNTNSSPEGGGTIVKCIAGDTLQVNTDSSVTTTGGTAPYFTSMSISRVNGPIAIAATEFVGASYTDTSGTALSTGADTTYTYATKTFDTHNAYSGGTYTIPASGKYAISATLWTQGFTLVTTAGFTVSIYKNGTLVAAKKTVGSGGSSTISGSVDGLIPCVAGDLITIKQVVGSAVNANTTAGFNNFNIARIGAF